MKLLFSEYPAKYDLYQFPYKVWAIEEVDTDRDMLLKMGFLPSRIKFNLWYLGRSLRINLASFIESSENRRIINNTQEYQSSPLENRNFRLGNNDYVWIGAFIEQVVSSSNYSLNSIKRIFSKKLSQTIFKWEKNKELVGYIPLMSTHESIFYWLGIYKLDMFTTGLGTRMMLDVIKWSKISDKKYVYLGTVYSNEALYKTNFRGWEFFDGISWSQDKEKLKYMIGKDQYSTGEELFMDKEFQQRFYRGDLKRILSGKGVDQQ